MDSKIKMLNANVDALNNGVRGRNGRNVKVDSYLDDLCAVRPQQREQVQSALWTVAEELKHLRVLAEAGRDPTCVLVKHSSEASKAQATAGATTQATTGAT